MTLWPVLLLTTMGVSGSRPVAAIALTNWRSACAATLPLASLDRFSRVLISMATSLMVLMHSSISLSSLLALPSTTQEVCFFFLVSTGAAATAAFLKRLTPLVAAWTGVDLAISFVSVEYLLI